MPAIVAPVTTGHGEWVRTCSIATTKALLVVCDSKEVWIPASQVHDDSEVYQPGTDGTLVIPRWIAEMKELPYRETRSLR